MIKQSQVCRGCNNRDKALYAKAYCKPCYQSNRRIYTHYWVNPKKAELPSWTKSIRVVPLKVTNEVSCSDCHTTSRKHYARGFCANCYMRRRMAAIRRRP